MKSRSQPETCEALVVLTGITANHVDRAHVLEYFRNHTRFNVFLPELHPYFGIRFAARQLCGFLKQYRLENFKRCHFICYISGGFILRCASVNCRLANLGRIVYLRSPIQERIPERSLQKYGYLLPLLIHGKILFDLASAWKDRLPEVDAETGYMIEQGISRLARQLGLRATDYDHYRTAPDFSIAEDKAISTTPLSHDEVYCNDALLARMAGFIDVGAFTAT